MVLKRPFISDTGKPLYVHSLGLGEAEVWAIFLESEIQGILPGDRASSHSPRRQTFQLIFRSNGKMVFKRPFISNTGEASSLNVHCSVLRKTEL